MALIHYLLASVALVVVVTPVYSVEFVGRYKLDTSDNFNEFLKEIGMGYFKRLAATASNSEYVVSQDKDKGTYTLATISTFKDSSITFKDGVEFDESRADGTDVKTTINIKDNKWLQVQKGSPEVTVVREFSDDGVTVKSTANGVTSTRVYKRQK